MENQKPFRHIADLYRNKILRREKGYEPGDSLPTQREMAAMHHVARATISSAMEVLIAEHLLMPHGNQPPTVARLDESVPSIEDRMKALHTDGKILENGETSEILECVRISCPADMSYHLGIEEGTEVLRRTRRNRRYGRPISVSRSFFPMFAVEAAPALEETEGIKGGARELAVCELNAVQVRSREIQTSRAATDKEKTLLELTGKFEAITHTVRIVWLDDNRVVEAAVKINSGSVPIVHDTDLTKV